MLELSIIKHLNKLKQKKFRKEEKEFVVEGIKGVMDALNSEMEVILVIVDGKLRDEKEFEKIILKAENKNVQVAFCGRNDIDKIKNTETFPGCLAVIDQLEILADQLTDGPIICLDAIKDPGNLGTIIRTADWFGFKNILSAAGLKNVKVVKGKKK